MRSKIKQGIPLTRRHFLKSTGSLGGGIPLYLVAPSLLSQAAPSSEPHRFVQIFLNGGWDSALATDPVIGSKISSGNYEASYQRYSSSTVTGKSNLIIGEGLQPAAGAFLSLSTAFVNGMFVEVTAHELAAAYMLSGQLTLSRSREYPAFIAKMAEAADTFPSHVVLGGPIPLADTKTSAPPLLAQSADMLAQMLQGPYNEWLSDDSINYGNSLINTLNSIRIKALPDSYTSGLQGWFNAERGLDSLYNEQYYLQLGITEDVMSRYNINPNVLWGGVPLLASAFLSLKAGLGRFFTVSFQGFDTHSGHFGKHIPLMQEFSTALNVFVNDLRTTPDPDDASLSLADTTTILITSEFVRTPTFNGAYGTDHWTSGSAILMGKGISDNVVVGATGDDAQAQGWVSSQATIRNDDTQLLPDHLAAGILNLFGFTDIADQISEKKIEEIFI